MGIALRHDHLIPGLAEMKPPTRVYTGTPAQFAIANRKSKNFS
jgi:hypothetical protein